jgi:hypothetical protein
MEAQFTPNFKESLRFGPLARPNIKPNLDGIRVMIIAHLRPYSRSVDVIWESSHSLVVSASY